MSMTENINAMKEQPAYNKHLLGTRHHIHYTYDEISQFQSTPLIKMRLRLSKVTKLVNV